MYLILMASRQSCELSRLCQNKTANPGTKLGRGARWAKGAQQVLSKRSSSGAETFHVCDGHFKQVLLEYGDKRLPCCRSMLTRIYCESRRIDGRRIGEGRARRILQRDLSKSGTSTFNLLWALFCMKVNSGHPLHVGFAADPLRRPFRSLRARLISWTCGRHWQAQKIRRICLKGRIQGLVRPWTHPC